LNFTYPLNSKPDGHFLERNPFHVRRLKGEASRPRRERVAEMYNPEIGFWGGMAILMSSITGPGLTTGNYD